MRLAQYLARAGVASRRQAEELIVQGKVRVNGIVVTELGSKVEPNIDQVEFDGQVLHSEGKVYILLNKPAGYISAVYDPQGRPVVVDLLPDIHERIYPVGRLDYDAEGLLLLTNDGDFTNLMIHPRYKINKRYQVWVKGKVKPEDISRLQKGILLEDGLTAPAQVEVFKNVQGESILEIVIHEGRKRQIKRMCAEIGHPVLRLQRTAFSFLTLQGVKPGNYRYLNSAEVKKLTLLAKS